MKQVNWGIIGLGAVAVQFANGFKYTSNSKLLGIASQDFNKIKVFSKNYNIDDDYCFDDYKNLIKNNAIDIIYISLPNFMHFEWIINCLKAGKKVLVEKPATINSLEAENIKKNYFNKETFFTEGFMYLYHPQIIKSIELIKSGEIGDLISMESVFGKNILTKKTFFGFNKKKKMDPQNRLYNKKMGGGAILDLGCYPVSFSSLIAGIKSDNSFNKIDIYNKKTQVGSTGVDLDSYADLKFNNNFTSKIGASFTKNLGNKTIIRGTIGELIIEDTWTAQTSKIIIKKKDNTEKAIHIKSNENIYSYEIESISQRIIDKKKGLNYFGLTIDDTIRNMKILDVWIK